MADAVIPRFRAERTAVPGTYDPERRPGSSGQRYFSDMIYANPNMRQRVFDPEAEGYETQVDYDARYNTAMDTAIDAARDTNRAQVTGLQALNLANPAMQQRPAALSSVAQPDRVPYYQPSSQDASGIANLLSKQTELVSEAGKRLPVGMTPAQRGVTSALNNAPNDMVAKLLNMGIFTPETASQFYQSRYPGLTAEDVQQALGQYGYAQGGNVNGYYLGGSTDGMADQIPASIDNAQPAALSDGEFVIPADVVSHLGNGNSDSGAKQLYGMMDNMRTARTGTKEQGRQIEPQKFLA